MVKKKKDTMTGITLGGILGLNVVGTIPAPASAAGIKAGFSTGVSNVGKALPVMGKIKGTTLVLKSTSKLKSAFNKIKLKGGIKL